MKIAICDDTQSERMQYSKMIKECILQLNLAVSFEEYAGPKEMLFAFDDPRCMPDILYLDINMPDMDGVAAFNYLKERGFSGQVVFLTKSTTHWEDAFDLQAYNYFIKGESRERFSRIFSNVVEEAKRRSDECIILTCCGEVVNIPLSKILYFESYRNVLKVHYDEDKTFEFYSTLGRIEEQLFNHKFFRVHKSYLVSAAVIAKVTFDTIHLRNGEELPCGRKYYKTVKQEMEKAK